MPESSTPERKKRVVGKPFQPGQSGNPGGMKREVAEFRRGCAQKLMEALECVGPLLLDPDPWVKLEAAKYLAKYGGADAKLAADDALQGLTDDELLSLLLPILEKRGTANASPAVPQ